MENGGGKYNIRKKDLLYPELGFKINGVLFDVFKQLGPGHQEKYFQKAVAEGLKRIGLNFREQVYVPLKYNDQVVGKYYLDFLIEDKIVLELKRGKIIPVHNIQQVKQYLTALHLKLAIIASFTYDGVVINRILNEY